jgi:gas vesicle protein
MALFSPKLAAGIAGGTFAIKSGNMGLAMGGGALAGAQFGKSFGPMGTAIGAAVGTITGAIMAPINALKAKKKEAKAMVDSYFENSFGEFAVQMSLLESGARKSGKKETTVVKSMEKQAKKYRDMANLMAKGSALGGKKSGRLSLIEEMTRFGGVGAGIGAATGTGIGLATGGIGLAPGIIIGGVAGGIAGAATGVASYGFRKGRDLLFGNSSDDKRTRKDQRAVLNDLYASGAMSKSDYDRLTKKKKRRFARDEEFDMDLVNAYFTEGQKKSAAMATAMETATTTLSSRLKVMTQMTGKSEMEMMELAQTMGVNLADSTADFNEQLIKLGITVKKTAQEIDMAIAEIMQNAAATAFDTAIKQQQAPQILDELVKNFRQDFNQRGDGANVTVEDASTIARGYAEQLTNMYGGDASAAYFALQEQIGSPQGLAFRETNPLTGKKNPLGGLGNQFFSGMTGQAMTKFLEESEKGVINTMTPQMGAVLAERGKMLKPGDMKKVTEQFKNLDFGQQQAFFNAITSGNIGSNTSDFFKQYGMNVGFDDISQQSAAFKMATDNAEKEMILLEAEREIIEGMGKFFGPESSNPEWWSKDALRELFIEAGVIKPEDTRTPRGSRIGDTVGSRLSRTLSRHQEMDSMLSGKRMITSSWRNYNLGSPSSDHVTGRAYDLVGNQLGMYKTIVEKNGGFAEFHGGSTNRHLHVVPGSGPMGDTYAPFKQPVATSAPVAPAGKGDISVTLNVNGLGIKEALPQIKAELERAMYEYQNRM